MAGQAVPTITATSTNNVGSSGTELQITWTEAVTGFEVGDIMVTIATPDVSNLGQTTTSSAGNFPVIAQKFTTGGGDSPHPLKNVQIHFSTVLINPDDLTVTIREKSGSNPSNTVRYELENPGNLGIGIGKKTFTAPNNATLDPDTDYFIVSNYSNTVPPHVSATSSRNEDNGVSDGWKIANDYRFYNNGNWIKVSIGSLFIAVNGSTATTAGTITNLSEVSSTSYTATYTPPGPNEVGTDELSIAAGVDDLGSSSATAAPLAITYDTNPRTITLSETARTVDEGGTATYTVVLDTQPTDDVTVTIASDDADAVTVSPGMLTFTVGNWDMAQTVTLTGVVDADGDDAMVMISHSATSSDGNYVIMDAGTVEVTVTDVNSAPTVPSLAKNANAPAGVSYSDDVLTISAVISADDALLTAESTDPDGDDVTYRLEPVAPSGSGLLDTLKIDENSGIITLNIALLAANDDQHAFKVVASDENFDVETEKQVLVIDIAPNVALSETDLSINEGETATYTIVLASQPTDVVTVTPESNDTDAVTVSGALMFTDNDWDTPQTVTIMGEFDADGDDTMAMISHSATSSDGNYVIMDAGTVEVDVTDVNSAPSVPILAENVNIPSGVGYSDDILTISSNVSVDDALITAESTDSDGDDVTYRLEAVAPSGVGLLDTLEIDESTGIITLKVDLTASNNNQHAFKVVASDGNFDVETEKQVLVIDITPNVALSETNLSINEGETATYTVVLANQPTDVVTVTPESNDTDAITVSGALMFTDNDWDTPQTVTIMGEFDADGDDAMAMISHSATSDDGNYVIMDAGTVEVTVTDVNSAPSVPILAENANAPSGVSYSSNIVTISSNVSVDDALITAESTDSDGDDVTYRLEVVAPSGVGLLDTLQIDENTGIITLKVALTAANNDQHAFKVVASDGNFDVETEKQVLVIDIDAIEPPNEDPSVPTLAKSANSPDGVGYSNGILTISTAISVNDALITAESIDPEGNPVSYLLESVAPSGIGLLDTLEMDANTGVITLKVALTAANNGMHTFKVVASDGKLSAETEIQVLEIDIEADEPVLGLSDSAWLCIISKSCSWGWVLHIHSVLVGDMMEIVDLEGHLLVNRTVRSINEQVSVSNLSAGTYLLIITSANGKGIASKVLPFIKE